MVERVQDIRDSFGGEITEEGRQALEAIAIRFGQQPKVTLEELKDFIRDELGNESPALAIMFGGGQEFMEALGFEPWMEDTIQETERFGEIPGVPEWVGFRKRETEQT